MIRNLWLLWLFALWLQAETIHWMGSFDAALKEAQSTGKPMLVLLVMHDCPPCRNQLASMSKENRIVELVNGKTIAVIVTKENEDYPIELLYTLEFPTLFLLSPEENFLMEPLRGETETPLLRRCLEEKLLNER